MLEKEFNKAKNNIINLFNRCRILDTVKLGQLKEMKKTDVDKNIDMKEVIKLDKLKLDMNKAKLAEYEYSKAILSSVIATRYPYMSDIEQRVLVNKAIKNIFELNVDIDKNLKLKEDIIMYAKLIKTGTHGFPLEQYLNGTTLSKIYDSEVWNEFINFLETHEEKIKTKPTARQDLTDAQILVANNVLSDLVNYDDITDYIVRTQYILETPVKDDIAMAQLVYQHDVEFVKNNGIKESAGLAKIYALRDTLTTINGLQVDEDKYKYIAEFNNIVKSFNHLKRSSKR